MSPAGDRLAINIYTSFETAWDNWVIALDGTDPQRISATAGNSEGPASWTRDGEWVLVTDYSDGLCCDVVFRRGRPFGEPAPTLHTMRSGPGGPVIIPFDTQLAAASDGRIAFTYQNALGMLNADGLFSTLHEIESENPDLYVHLKAPMWSPDEESLAFLEVVTTTPGTSGHDATRVWRLDLATDTVALLGEVSGSAHITNIIHDQAQSACWTPYGSTIVFTAAGANLSYAVFAMPPSGGTPTQITSPASDAMDASVSCF